MEKKGYVYILFSRRGGAVYTGVTSDLVRRVYQHKQGMGSEHTKKYKINKLGYYEVFTMVADAILREKQIKGGSRKKKNELVESINPYWKDLYWDIVPK